MSEYAGRTVISAIVVAAIVISFAFELNAYLPANSSTGPSTSGSVLATTSWFGDFAPPAGCGNMTIRTSGRQAGYNISVYVSSTNLPGVALLGSKVCIYTHLQNTSNESTWPPAGEDLYVTNVDASNTSRYSGTVFFRDECAVPAIPPEVGPNGFGSNSTGWNCNMVWDTSQPYDGLVPTNVWPDVYMANATVRMSKSSTIIGAPASFSFAPEPITSTTWSGNGAPPRGCGNSTLMGYSTVDGYKLEVYSPSQPVSTGSSLCVYTRLLNLDNPSTSFPANESLAITSSATPGFEYFQAMCFPSQSWSFGPNSTSWNCAAVWNTSTYAPPASGAPPTVYQVVVGARLSNSSAVVQGGSNLRIVLSGESSTTASTNAGSPFRCPGQFKRESPSQNSSLFLRVVNDNGTVINFNDLPNNGTVFVTHTFPAGAEATSGAPDYCLTLFGDDNSTGYLPLVGNESLPAAGSYNLTLFAGYGGGPGYAGTVPAVTVGPNSTVYITISVPSGRVTVVDCQAGACSTTTSTATALGGPG